MRETRKSKAIAQKSNDFGGRWSVLMEIVKRQKGRKKERQKEGKRKEKDYKKEEEEGLVEGEREEREAWE